MKLKKTWPLTPTKQWKLMDYGQWNIPSQYHMADNISNLTSATELPGNEEIIIGDGNDIPILHIGHTTLHSNSTTHPFTVHQVLCSPKIKQNLISAAQFSRENLTSIDFFPYSCLVKDLSKGQSYFKGGVKMIFMSGQPSSLPSYHNYKLTLQPNRLRHSIFGL
ncbi:hypothetical protein A4A49_54908 [Nicotiana attenuata]|uniref:Retrovirus-related Pol polyprotein from transposon TNT 1-94-like beta-barrel domain-containing protein n=1 Tax=Nicotiana attenuata TaxID=49451 RepID=A0A314L612_NICAT|nr:hypothetical protein A4A49_54908 [Nicotiana attenuata]